MTKRRILAFLAVAALVLLAPAMVTAQPAPPHRFYGTAKLDGANAADGTAVAAIIDGATVASTTVSGGSYTLTVVQPEGASYAGKTVSFKVGAYTAAQTAIWAMGELTNLNLTASAIVVEALAPLGANLVRVWGFDAAAQAWKMYDPAVPSQSDLSVLNRGQGYWIKVTTAQTLVVGGFSYSLSAGWNLIGWQGY